MPEQISKYPEVTMQVLQGAGGRCGTGADQKILSKCPSERFCSFPSGEICVYGLDQIGQMTQITSADVASALRATQGAVSMQWAGVLTATFSAGLIAGALLCRWLSKRGRMGRGA